MVRKKTFFSLLILLLFPLYFLSYYLPKNDGLEYVLEIFHLDAPPLFPSSNHPNVFIQGFALSILLMTTPLIGFGTLWRRKNSRSDGPSIKKLNKADSCNMSP